MLKLISAPGMWSTNNKPMTSDGIFTISVEHF